MAAHISLTLDVERFAAQIARFIAATEAEADTATLAVAADVLADTVEHWPVDTGFSRAAWWGPRREGVAHYQIGNPARYASIIEHGGYPNPGMKTARFAGTRLAGGFTINPGVYPLQVPQAPLRRALANNYEKLSGRIKDATQKRWGA